jgi:hypothetical protein
MHALKPLAPFGMVHSGLKKWKRLSGVRFSWKITITCVICEGKADGLGCAIWDCATRVPDRTSSSRELAVNFISILLVRPHAVRILGDGRAFPPGNNETGRARHYRLAGKFAWCKSYPN